MCNGAFASHLDLEYSVGKQMPLYVRQITFCPYLGKLIAGRFVRLFERHVIYEMMSLDDAIMSRFSKTRSVNIRFNPDKATKGYQKVAPEVMGWNENSKFFHSNKAEPYA
ncbi:hypothetical protein AVEN_215253-1 [Araneus ventricosus]|uniref:Uncharacterized protein n=1 Tax=Araneus ventricosus TaxID=182803 RepID=A0A4Y1ZK67_ARAVE|nr:hypothetical protein AVEN_215253-1 [Araneus ventricosus]